MPRPAALDGYDYTATVPPGTPTLVRSADGRTWRLTARGIRYHEDASTRLHGARAVRPPAVVAASDRIRAVLERTLDARGDLPPGDHGASTVWTDGPSPNAPLASRDSLTVYPDGWVQAVRPVYDGAPRAGARPLSARERAALVRDMAVAPQGVHVLSVEVRERRVRVEGSDPRAALASTITGATATRSRRVYAREAGYAEALAAPGARVWWDGGPVDVPEPGTAWEVPVTAWRTATRPAAESGA